MAFAGYQVNIQMDISAEKMIFGVAGVDPKRREELIKASPLRSVNSIIKKNHGNPPLYHGIV